MPVAESLGRVMDRVRAAAVRARRRPDEVTLIGISKTMPVERIREAVRAGLTHLGENKVQEAASKIPDLAVAPAELTWHLVGHLQSNKAGKAAELFDCIHSVDSEKVAVALGRHAVRIGKVRAILIQVDLGGEPTKSGVEPTEVRKVIDLAARTDGVKVLGLMTIPPASAEPQASRPWFERLRRLRDELAGPGLELRELSMGMTNDFEVAIEEGATMVRVGRAIFGDRV